MNTKTREAVRTIGYLLETNGTTKAWARNKSRHAVSSLDNKACKWCLDGAISVVRHRMGGDDLYQTVVDILNLGTVNGGDNLIGTWDDSTQSQRQEIVKILKNA